MSVDVINPLYAWVELLKQTPELTALVDPSRIALDLGQVETPPEYAWLVVSSARPFRAHPLRVWSGAVRLTAFAPQNSFFRAQQVVDVAVNALWDPITQWRRWHLDSGSQAGAVIGVVEPLNLARTREQLSDDDWHAAWAMDFETTVSMEAMAWS